jgi:hypothetical protein
MFELHKMEQRLARKATALGVGAQLEGPVGDAVNHAFARAHEAPAGAGTWTARFELMATEYLEDVARDQLQATPDATNSPAVDPGADPGPAEATLPLPTESGNR